RVVGRLSHGLRQWVELGTVLAGNPELILLDEPAAGMTHDEVARTAELVREINRTHALIVVEHDMQFVRMIARRATVMHQGVVLVEDTMDQILKNRAVRDIYLGKYGGAGTVLPGAPRTGGRYGRIPHLHRTDPQGAGREG